jgi:hypothetical protein
MTGVPTPLLVGLVLSLLGLVSLGYLAALITLDQHPEVRKLRVHVIVGAALFLSSVVVRSVYVLSL